MRGTYNGRRFLNFEDRVMEDLLNFNHISSDWATGTFDYFLDASQINRAVRVNQQYARSLGWHPYLDQIAYLIGLDRTPNWDELAEAVAYWQLEQGLDPDGIIGPNTWTQMQMALGLRPSSPSPASVPASTKLSPSISRSGSGVHITDRVGSKTVSFHVYAQIPGLEERIQATLRNLRRLPPEHLSVIDPIFIVNCFPRARAKCTGGGYLRPQEVKRWLGRKSITGVPDEDIQTYVLSQPNSGIIGISRTAFSKKSVMETQFTVFHELAHSVAYHLGGLLPPGATVSHFRGVTYPHPSVDEYAAEAYARFILVPQRICRVGHIPIGETNATCSQRLINVLMRSPAFRNIPRNWRPPN